MYRGGKKKLRVQFAKKKRFSLQRRQKDSDTKRIAPQNERRARKRFSLPARHRDSTSEDSKDLQLNFPQNAEATIPIRLPSDASSDGSSDTDNSSRHRKSSGGRRSSIILPKLKSLLPKRTSHSAFFGGAANVLTNEAGEAISVTTVSVNADGKIVNNADHKKTTLSLDCQLTMLVVKVEHSATQDETDQLYVAVRIGTVKKRTSKKRVCKIHIYGTLCYVECVCRVKSVNGQMSLLFSSG